MRGFARETGGQLTWRGRDDERDEVQSSEGEGVEASTSPDWVRIATTLSHRCKEGWQQVHEKGSTQNKPNQAFRLVDKGQRPAETRKWQQQQQQQKGCEERLCRREQVFPKLKVTSLPVKRLFLLVSSFSRLKGADCRVVRGPQRNWEVLFVSSCQPSYQAANSASRNIPTSTFKPFTHHLR